MEGDKGVDSAIGVDVGEDAAADELGDEVVGGEPAGGHVVCEEAGAGGHLADEECEERAVVEERVARAVGAGAGRGEGGFAVVDDGVVLAEVREQHDVERVGDELGAQVVRVAEPDVVVLAERTVGDAQRHVRAVLLGAGRHGVDAVPQRRGPRAVREAEQVVPARAHVEHAQRALLGGRQARLRAFEVLQQRAVAARRLVGPVLRVVHHPGRRLVSCRAGHVPCWRVQAQCLVLSRLEWFCSPGGGAAAAAVGVPAHKPAYGKADCGCEQDVTAPGVSLHRCRCFCRAFAHLAFALLFRDGKKSVFFLSFRFEEIRGVSSLLPFFSP